MDDRSVSLNYYLSKEYRDPPKAFWKYYVILSNWGTIDEPFKAYYGSIPASAVGEWYQRYGNRLFAKNIRYYKGSTDVNQGIKEVLRTEPATIEDPLHQITLDEAIIAQACSIDELSIVALAKRNVGALTENINKTPYKLLFNGGTNSFSLTNNVWIARVVDSFLAQNESSATGRKRLVLVHGNRFLLHMILSEMKQYANYLTAFFDAKSLPELVNPLCQKYWELTFSAMEEKYPDAYPAHIFKNIGRLREIKEQICLRDSKSQEE